MKLTSKCVNKIAGSLSDMPSGNCDCDLCYDCLDQYAELLAAGKPAGELMPEVKEHLETCGCCREELDALLQVMAATP